VDNLLYNLPVYLLHSHLDSQRLNQVDNRVANHRDNLQVNHPIFQLVSPRDNLLYNHR
jgi:hypothetical protein